MTIPSTPASGPSQEAVNETAVVPSSDDKMLDTYSWWNRRHGFQIAGIICSGIVVATGSIAGNWFIVGIHALIMLMNWLTMKANIKAARQRDRLAQYFETMKLEGEHDMQRLMGMLDETKTVLEKDTGKKSSAVLNGAFEARGGTLQRIRRWLNRDDHPGRF